MAKYTWRPTPQSLRNIVILLILVIILVAWIVSMITNTINSIVSKRIYKESAKKVAVLRDDYEAEGMTYPSGVINAAVTKTLPSVITEYVWYNQNSAQFDASIKSFAYTNNNLVHFLYQYGNGKTSGTSATLTDAETSGGVPTYYTWDERWGYKEYGDSVLGLNGSGPTALSMAIVGLTGDKSATPAALAAFAEDEDLYYEGYGSAWALVPYAADEYDLYYEEVILDEEALKSQLDEGRVVVIIMSGNTMSPGTGFILLVGYNSNGFIIRDPFSQENTEKVWTYVNLSKNIDAIWALWKG